MRLFSLVLLPLVPPPALQSSSKMTTCLSLLYTSESPLTRDSDLPFPVGLLLASILCLRFFSRLLLFAYRTCCLYNGLLLTKFEFRPFETFWIGIPVRFL